MCGRFVSRDEAAIERYFNVMPQQLRFTDRFNVAPTQDVPVVRLIDGERVMSNMHWGMIPFWANDKKIGYKTINARAETVATTPVYRVAYMASNLSAFSYLGKPVNKSEYGLSFLAPASSCLMASATALASNWFAISTSH